jgi:calcineurin-like phosphoesterase family protein
MIKIDKNKNVFITSDTHYGHSNICRGTTNWRLPDGSIPIDQTRDFETIEKMNDTIVNNINSMVGQDDVLIHLGDWSFGGFDNIKKFRERIICKEIHIILGNHDHHILNNKENVRELFTSVSEYNTLKYLDSTFVLFHYPITSWNGLNKGDIHLHGHVHLSNDKKFGRGKKMDVGVDGNNLKPYSIKEIIELMNEREILSDMLFDHHTDELKGVVG